MQHVQESLYISSLLYFLCSLFPLLIFYSTYPFVTIRKPWSSFSVFIFFSILHAINILLTTTSKFYKFTSNTTSLVTLDYTTNYTLVTPSLVSPAKLTNMSFSSTVWLPILYGWRCIKESVYKSYL